ncbi:DUF2914 domain-containing protein [Candidatus Uhrbacteria bacterium]|nr:DUF2914 domain-containing protein [Candidatus Uhrbacteria bacterium]
MRDQLKRLQHFFEKYERVLLPFMLLFGVSTDYLAFKTIDTNVAFLWLGLHLMLAPVAIFYINRYDAGLVRIQNKFTSTARMFAPLLLQLSFGALLNASFVFYWFSASFSVSWPFFVVVVLLMVSNDVFRHWFVRPAVQIGVYFFACFSVLALMIPYLANSIEARWFYTAGLVSVVVVETFGYGLSRSIKPVKHSHVWMPLAGVFIVMNGLYFFNLIPPIPLSLREAEIAHRIDRLDGSYRLAVEPENWLERFLPGQTIHVRPGESVYLFSSIFAPAKLNTKIVHRWQVFDNESRAWIDKDQLSFYVSGGREEGYRGYSRKSTIVPGKWRVRIETVRGQVIGIVSVRIINVDQSPVFVEEEH